jgi:hypothetical protein
MNAGGRRQDGACDVETLSRPVQEALATERRSVAPVTARRR